MPFQLPALPNFQTTIPQMPNPVDQAAKVETLRGMLSENALRQQLAPLQVEQQQQTVQSQEMQNEMQKIQLQGQQALTQWLTQGDVNEEVTPEDFKLNNKIATYVGVDPKDPIMGVVRNMAQHGVPAPMLMAEAQQMLQRRTEYSKGTEEQQGIIKNNYEVWKDATAQLYNADPKDRSIVLANMLPRLREATHLSPELDQMLNLLQTDPAKGIPVAYNLVAAQDKALGLSESASKAAEAAQKVIPPGASMSPDTQQQVAKEVALQPEKVEVAKAEAAAREQIQVSMEPIRKQIDQQFQDQKDARDKIESSVLKPYQDKMTDITMARNALSQALDNPVSARAAIFKMIGVAQPSGSHRVIPAEISAFKYPGNIEQRSIERFNDFLLGKPFTSDAVSAMNSFIDGQAQAAQQNLGSGIDNVNKLYGTQVGAGLKNQGGKITVTAPDGSVHPFDTQAQADTFKKLAGIK